MPGVLVTEFAPVLTTDGGPFSIFRFREGGGTQTFVGGQVVDLTDNGRVEEVATAPPDVLGVASVSALGTEDVQIAGVAGTLTGGIPVWLFDRRTIFRGHPTTFTNVDTVDNLEPLMFVEMGIDVSGGGVHSIDENVTGAGNDQVLFVDYEVVDEDQDGTDDATYMYVIGSIGCQWISHAAPVLAAGS